ncbi:hypothetical protein EJB05_23579, partial [Eragrostis curvula]
MDAAAQAPRVDGAPPPGCLLRAPPDGQPGAPPAGRQPGAPPAGRRPGAPLPGRGLVAPPPNLGAQSQDRLCNPATGRINDTRCGKPATGPSVVVPHDLRARNHAPPDPPPAPEPISRLQTKSVTRGLDLNFPPHGVDDEVLINNALIVDDFDYLVPGDLVHGATHSEGLLEQSTENDNTAPSSHVAATEENTVDTGDTLHGDSDDEDGAEVMSTPPEPYLTQTFDSWKAAQKYYQTYARHKGIKILYLKFCWYILLAGFAIRIATSRNAAGDNQRDKVRFVCHKSGKNTENKTGRVVKIRRRDFVERTYCPGYLVVKRRGLKLWEIIQYNGEHNHPCLTNFSLTKYLAAHRDIPEEEKKFIMMMYDCKMETSRAYELISELYGGRKNCPYIEKDMDNLRTAARADIKGKDVASTFRYFEEIKKSDFFYKFDVDDENKITNLFWIDGTARKTYGLYRDCISFDATYMTNLYNLPCAPFIGINRHGQTVQLGCGFLHDETTESFVWLFQQFLDAVGGVAPVNIITDQDAAMAASIARVFIGTVHRNCRWHIISKFQIKVAKLFNTKGDLDKDVNDILNFSLSKEEFEYRWDEMLTKHDLHDNDHFRHLYELRARFVPAYYMKDFFPFLQTTARSEGFNAVLKRYVNPMNSILNFVQQYKKIQDKIFCAEERKEAETSIKKPRLHSGYDFEDQMWRIYTRNIFYKLQGEIQLMTYYDIDDLGSLVYKLTPTKSALHYGMTVYHVQVDAVEEKYNCTCCKYDRDGILCAHVLSVFQRLKVKNIPAHYINQRWCQEPPEEEHPLLGESSLNQQTFGKMSNKSQKIVRYSNMCREFSKIADIASSNEKGCQIIKKLFRSAEEELSKLKGSRRSRRSGVESETAVHVEAAATHEVPVASDAAAPGMESIQDGIVVDQSMFSSVEPGEVDLSCRQSGPRRGRKRKTTQEGGAGAASGPHTEEV